MTESDALAAMVSPGMKRPGKPLGGVIQIHITRACDRSCYMCTQGSNLGGKTEFIKPELFERAVLSLKTYFGIVGVFGGNPALHPKFNELCEILRKHIPKERCGLWCNHPITLDKAVSARATFNPRVSNLNCHLDQSAYDLFKLGWPESMPFGLTDDSRHSPPYVAMKDVVKSEEERWTLISDCDINKHWSAMIGVFRGELRAWFCEIAGAQAMLHQHEPEYPDTGLDPTELHEHEVRPGERLERTVGAWWQLGMPAFAAQVRKHCHECGVPLRGHGALAQGSEDQKEQVSETHRGVYKPKRPGRVVELVVLREQLGEPLGTMTKYIQNAREG